MNDIKALILAALNESISDGMLVENINSLAADIEQRVTVGVRANVVEEMGREQQASQGLVTKLDVYQALAARTIDDTLSDRDKLAMFALGLGGEAGEMIDPIKKFLFHSNPKPLDREYYKLEIGDELWYLAGLARHFKLSLSDCATANIRKLEQRHAERIKGVKPQIVESEPTAPILPARQPGQSPRRGPARRTRSNYAEQVASRVRGSAGGEGASADKEGFFRDE